MKKFLTIVLSAVLGITTLAAPVHADFASCHYGGYQPWWNIFAKRNPCMSCEEERLQRFWHDYYDALSRYYQALDHIDWVAYYKNHGYQINGACAARVAAVNASSSLRSLSARRCNGQSPTAACKARQWARRAWACRSTVIKPGAGAAWHECQPLPTRSVSEEDMVAPRWRFGLVFFCRTAFPGRPRGYGRPGKAVLRKNTTTS